MSDDDKPADAPTINLDDPPVWACPSGHLKLWIEVEAPPKRCPTCGSRLVHKGEGKR